MISVCNKLLCVCTFIYLEPGSEFHNRKLNFESKAILDEVVIIFLNVFLSFLTYFRFDQFIAVSFFINEKNQRAKVEQSATDPSRKLMAKLLLLLAIYHLQLKPLAVEGNSCRGKKSQTGFALLNTTFISSFAPSLSACVVLCFEDPRCKSINFCWKSSTCDLNLKTKEHTCSHYARNVAEPSSSYVGVAKNPGNVRK